MSRSVAGVALFAVVTAASAHAVDAADAPGWTTDPAIVVPLALSAGSFAIGWWRLAARSRAGRQLRRRALRFAAGWAVLAAALLSPLHEAGEHSFAAHMVEHELIMLLAAPLLVLAEPLVVMLWAWPAAMRKAIGAVVSAPVVTQAWKRLSGPLTATSLQAAALWLWHAPALFDRALASDGWHAAQHASFLVTALLFWTAMLRRPPGDTGARGGVARTAARGGAARTAARGIAALCLFATSIVSGALGALMAFSLGPWYAGYARLGLAPYGLTAAEDQQLAGLIMWIPGGLVHAIVALVVVRTLFREPAPRGPIDAV